MIFNYIFFLNFNYIPNNYILLEKHFLLVFLFIYFYEPPCMCILSIFDIIKFREIQLQLMFPVYHFYFSNICHVRKMLQSRRKSDCEISIYLHILGYFEFDTFFFIFTIMNVCVYVNEYDSFKMLHSLSSNLVRILCVAVS